MGVDNGMDSPSNDHFSRSALSYNAAYGTAERYEYDVYGKAKIWNAARTTQLSFSQYGNPYMFTGREYDAETGNYYYRARYYKPEIGRFLQPDPIGFVGGINLYTYVSNNPINWTDPWGLRPGDLYLGQDSAATAASLDIYGKLLQAGKSMVAGYTEYGIGQEEFTVTRNLL